MRVTSVLVVALLLVSLARRTPVRLSARDLPLIAVVGIGDAAANLTFGWASTRGLVSVVAVLGSLYPVVTVLLARVVHHERLAAVQNIGVVAALAGVGLIAAG
jgi:drug/metabolite transporter (DMT)-like permease